MSALRRDESLKRFDIDDVVGKADGIHVDIWPGDSLSRVVHLITIARTRWPTHPYDLHFISPRADAADICHQALLCNAQMRRAWGRQEMHVEMAAPAFSAAEIAMAGVPIDRLTSEHLLLTAPGAHHSPVIRARLINQALRMASPGRSIVLDRDLNLGLAHLVSRELVDEIVVGKAIWNAGSPVDVLSQIKEEWSNRA